MPRIQAFIEEDTNSPLTNKEENFGGQSCHPSFSPNSSNSNARDRLNLTSRNLASGNNDVQSPLFLSKENSSEINGEIIKSDEIIKSEEISPATIRSLTSQIPQFECMAEALDHHAVGLNEIAQTVGYVMRYGESDAAKLNAARLASELRGIAKGKENNTINFIISDANGVNLMNIFNPQR